MVGIAAGFERPAQTQDALAAIRGTIPVRAFPIPDELCGLLHCDVID